MASIAEAMSGVGQPYEVVVVDDGSVDGTAKAAEAAGAKVVRVRLRHIAAARNAGARTAMGDVLIFMDADTELPGETLRQRRCGRGGRGDRGRGGGGDGPGAGAFSAHRLAAVERHIPLAAMGSGMLCFRASRHF